MAFFFLKASFLMMGLSGIIAQIILLRELLVSFYGNELTLGIILANWLVLEAVGSFVIGKSVEKTERKLEIYALLQMILSVAFPAALYLSRIFKNFLLTTPGEAVGFGPIFYSSFIVLLPVAIPHGALFTYGSKLYSQYFKEDAASIGKVYYLETIGTVLGGLGITYLFIPYLDSFEIAFILSLINSLVSLFLLWPGRKPSSHLFPDRPLDGLSLLSLLYTVSLLSPATKKMDWSSIRSRWKGVGVIHNENSIYGNIAVARRGGTVHFLYEWDSRHHNPGSGCCLHRRPGPLPDASSRKPQSVLVLGGGAGGMIHEILKHPVARIDYVELDPLLLKLVRQFSTPLTQSELSNPRVKIHYVDGRFFILKTRTGSMSSSLGSRPLRIYKQTDFSLRNSSPSQTRR